MLVVACSWLLVAGCRVLCGVRRVLSVVLFVVCGVFVVCWLPVVEVFDAC